MKCQVKNSLNYPNVLLLKQKIQTIFHVFEAVCVVKNLKVILLSKKSKIDGHGLECVKIMIPFPTEMKLKCFL